MQLLKALPMKAYQVHLLQLMHSRCPQGHRMGELLAGIPQQMAPKISKDFTRVSETEKKLKKLQGVAGSPAGHTINFLGQEAVLQKACGAGNLIGTLLAEGSNQQPV